PPDSWKECPRAASRNSGMGHGLHGKGLKSCFERVYRVSRRLTAHTKNIIPTNVYRVEVHFRPCLHKSKHTTTKGRSTMASVAARCARPRCACPLVAGSSQSRGDDENGAI